MNKLTIAIDGHSSTGKSTLAKELAAVLGYIYVDSGAMYRAVALEALRKGWVSKEQGVQEENQEGREERKEEEEKSQQKQEEVFRGCVGFIVLLCMLFPVHGTGSTRDSQPSGMKSKAGAQQPNSSASNRSSRWKSTGARSRACGRSRPAMRIKLSQGWP